MMFAPAEAWTRVGQPSHGARAGAGIRRRDNGGGRLEIRLERVMGSLPAEFEALRAEARGNGHRMLDTLAREWSSGATRFDRPGEVLDAAYIGDVLAGIGGLTQEPTIPNALRMRRFYVRLAYRRFGVGLALATALLDDARAKRLTVTANAAAGSEAFWETLGFRPDRRDGYTHVLRLNDISSDTETSRSANELPAAPDRSGAANGDHRLY